MLKISLSLKRTWKWKMRHSTSLSPSRHVGFPKQTKLVNLCRGLVLLATFYSTDYELAPKMTILHMAHFFFKAHVSTPFEACIKFATSGLVCST